MVEGSSSLLAKEEAVKGRGVLLARRGAELAASSGAPTMGLGN